MKYYVKIEDTGPCNWLPAKKIGPFDTYCEARNRSDEEYQYGATFCDITIVNENDVKQ